MESGTQNLATSSASWSSLAGFFLLKVGAQSNGSLKVTVRDNRGFPDSNAALTLVSDDRLRKVRVNEAGEFEFADFAFREL